MPVSVLKIDNWAAILGSSHCHAAVAASVPGMLITGDVVSVTFSQGEAEFERMLCQTYGGTGEQTLELTRFRAAQRIQLPFSFVT